MTGTAVNPTLRAAFLAHLTDNEVSYESLLQDTNLPLQPKIVVLTLSGNWFQIAATLQHVWPSIFAQRFV